MQINKKDLSKEQNKTKSKEKLKVKCNKIDLEKIIDLLIEKGIITENDII